MYVVIDVFVSKNDVLAIFVVMYFSFMVLLGNFFMLNLALAVVWDEYSKENEIMLIQQAQEERKLCRRMWIRHRRFHPSRRVLCRKMGKIKQ